MKDRLVRLLGVVAVAVVPGSLTLGLPAWAAWRWWSSRAAGSKEES